MLSPSFSCLLYSYNGSCSAMTFSLILKWGVMCGYMMVIGLMDVSDICSVCYNTCVNN